MLFIFRHLIMLKIIPSIIYQGLHTLHTVHMANDTIISNIQILSISNKNNEQFVLC